MMTKQRCIWADSHELMQTYHDGEWGVPQYDDRKLFEMLCLEGAQAGLSWLTVLKKRDAYREAFDYFDPTTIALYDEEKRASLLQNASIIRNKLKINAFIENARAYCNVLEFYDSFRQYVWQFNPQATPLSRRQQQKAQLASIEMSAQLKKDGFKFVGPTICFAFMQATGMINDHEKGCFLAT